MAWSTWAAGDGPLGIHLHPWPPNVQPEWCRPAIKTNTNLRIAMRVTDAMDSTDVIDSQLAARIAKSNPGRGYIRIGHEQLLEFQAARVGGRRRDLVADGSQPSLRVVTPETIYQPKPEQRVLVLNDETDLTLLVQEIVAATEASEESPRLPARGFPLYPSTLLLSDVAGRAHLVLP